MPAAAAGARRRRSARRPAGWRAASRRSRSARWRAARCAGGAAPARARPARRSGCGPRATGPRPGPIACARWAARAAAASAAPRPRPGQAPTSSPASATLVRSRSRVDANRPAPAPRSSASKASSSWRSQPCGSDVSAPWTARPIWRAHVVAVVDEQSSRAASRVGVTGTDAARAGQARQAAARQPHDQLGGAAVSGARPRAPAELRQHEVERGLALLVERLPHGGERRGGEPRILHVVEADDRDVGRDLQLPLLQRRDRAQRHVVVGGHESVEVELAVVDQQRSPRLRPPFARTSPGRRESGSSPMPCSSRTAR